jgi:uncharacterized membrane protein YqaE (UPF0057 family)
VKERCFGQRFLTVAALKSGHNSYGGQAVTLIEIIIAIFLPPVAAFMKVGLGAHFWINIILTLIGWFPGSVHALWLVARK